MKNDVIELVAVLKGRDKDGFEKEKGRKTLEVMAEIKSVRQSEFYQAASAGIDVRIVAAVNIEDYEEAAIVTDDKKTVPELIVHDNTEYKIIRVWKKGKRMELTLQEVE